MMTSLDINANPGESEDDEVEISSMKTVPRRRRSKNSSENDDFGLIEVHNININVSCNADKIINTDMSDTAEVELGDNWLAPSCTIPPS